MHLPSTSGNTFSSIPSLPSFPFVSFHWTVHVNVMGAWPSQHGIPSNKFVRFSPSYNLEFPLSSEDVPTISERHRRFPKVLWFFLNVAKDFRRCSGYFQNTPKIPEGAVIFSEHSQKIFEDVPTIFEHYWKFLIPKTSNKHLNITFTVILLYYLRQI